MELQLTDQQKMDEIQNQEKDNTEVIVILNGEMMAVKNVNRALKGEMETNAESLNAVRQQIQAIETKHQQQMDELKQNNEPQRQQEEVNRKLQIEKCANEIQRLIETKLENAKFINFGFLEWRIDNLSQQKRGECIYSKPFYSGPSGYKMCLVVITYGGIGIRFNIGGDIFVGFHLMRGESDDKLAWPFKCAVTIDAVNPADGNICHHATVKYSDWPGDAGWGKPSRDMNDLIGVYGGYNDFIPMNSPATSNNKIHLKCKVDPE